jgi:hypothetical protein
MFRLIHKSTAQGVIVRIFHLLPANFVAFNHFGMAAFLPQLIRLIDTMP